MTRGKRAAMFQVTAGDKNAALSDEERRTKLIASGVASSELLAQLDQLDDKGAAVIKAALGVDPEHAFKVVVPEGFDEFTVASRLVFERLNAKTSADLPRPFNMVRLDEEVLVALPRTAKNR